MKYYLKTVLSVVVLLWSSAAFAQIKVKGTVEDADGPLIGASVLVKGTTVGTITDMDGQYIIEANRQPHRNGLKRLITHHHWRVLKIY